MERDILAEAQRLRANNHPFSLATVVMARQPTSGTPGARAIIHAGGEIEGWVGGHCAQPAVVREALAALADGSPRLVVLRPGSQHEGSVPGVVEVPMLCASEGELHVFVEPFLPRIALVVIGASPIARTLTRLAGALDFDVWACDPVADMHMFPDATRLIQSLSALRPQLTERNYVVVATINDYDEEAVETALRSDASYVGLIASQKRLAAMRETLRLKGITEDRLSRLDRPKGLPGTAIRPGEIALSALAAVVEVRRAKVGLHFDSPQPRAEAIDPICGMTVDIATAQHTLERGGQTYYFCCSGCRERFESQ